MSSCPDGYCKRHCDLYCIDPQFEGQPDYTKIFLFKQKKCPTDCPHNRAFDTECLNPEKDKRYCKGGK
jgi:hypothetical protein